MKRILTVVKIVIAFVALFSVNPLKAQQDTGSFKVKGESSKFYVVRFKDAALWQHEAAELILSRINIHEDSAWSGSLVAKFRFRIDAWANGPSFIDADIKQKSPYKNTFIAAWRDGTFDNASGQIIIWLRGNTTYHYKAPFSVGPISIHDGVSNPVDYKPGATTYTFKTAVDANVNTNGMTYAGHANFNGTGSNYFAGSVGIGVINKSATYKLAVDGTIGARKIKVTQETWADFVFDKDYELPSLQELNAYIKEHKHLPGVPSTEEVTKKDLDLGEMNKILLQKIEELTLHLIEQDKQNQEQKQQIELLNKKLDAMQAK
ncbi:hypothetical protein [Chitinophaga pinensis]|uniref:Uncharacterized protein n=1 Tax=Chitinophaga pinensis (strain ATCC 43595 / DSM 2588 / LMG 13176 / NBRC 15968 / NCIMB 11800 / UQM 2034) TaxID=485918 RepID=A0A979GS67_CHIPD|nr:hypothetical protein [Chitinophaga pinensis]ACU62842.1 hypothetical protein Cpin_5413 [Chitinophaga pinensis DSM 2588]